MVVVTAACPLTSVTGLPTLMPFSWNCTVPVGVAAPVEASTTFAVNVIFPFGVTLLVEAVAVVVEANPAEGSTWIAAHHAGIFVLQNVAVINERADNIRIAEIHAHFHAWIRSAAAPVRQIDRVADGRIVDWLAIHFKHLKMNLMDVKDVIFERRILDHPIFDRARMDNDVRRLFMSNNAGAALLR